LATTQPAAVTHAAEQNIKSQATGPVQFRFESIDGLRGLACLMVLLYHSWAHFGHGPWPGFKIGGVDVRPAHLFGYGYGGVDLFFVLSGFCLAYPIVSKPGKAVDWKRYFVHRVRCIIPAYWAALLLFGTFSWIITRHDWEPFFKAQVDSWPGIHQLVYTIFLVSSSFNSSFWTLPLEWRWYFVFPLMILAWKPLRGVGVILAALLIAVVYIHGVEPRQSARMGFLLTMLPVFLPLFALGIYAAELCVSSKTTRVGQFLVRYAHWGILAALLPVAHWALWINTVGDGSHVDRWLPRIATWGTFWFFVVLAATREGTLKRFTSWRPLVLVGTFSYSLYLIHEPFLRTAAALVLPLHWTPGLQLLFSEVLLPVILVGLGYLFFLIAEKPFLRRPVKKAIEAEQFVLAAPAGIPGK
jgi:peptidoglycan/LPS O-acetylase OafA/YrhL